MLRDLAGVSRLLPCLPSPASGRDVGASAESRGNAVDRRVGADAAGAKCLASADDSFCSGWSISCSFEFNLLEDASPASSIAASAGCCLVSPFSLTHARLLSPITRGVIMYFFFMVWVF